MNLYLFLRTFVETFLRININSYNFWSYSNNFFKFDVFFNLIEHFLLRLLIQKKLIYYVIVESILRYMVFWVREMHLNSKIKIVEKLQLHLVELIPTKKG